MLHAIAYYPSHITYPGACMHMQCNRLAGCFPPRSCLLITSSALARVGSALFEAAAAFLSALIHLLGRRRRPYKQGRRRGTYGGDGGDDDDVGEQGREEERSDFKNPAAVQLCKSGLSSAGGGGSVRSSSPPGYFSVYVGPERERFVVRAECANHPLFRRLLDDAEREYRYAAQGPLALPGCDVDAFLDVLWQMEREQVAGAASSPICSLHSGSKGRAAGYRMMSSPMVGKRR